jgi:hypothetical protein
MIRVIIDKLGSGHHDLFLKIDAIPEYSGTADSYYLFDFLEVSDSDFEKLNLKKGERIKYGTIELLKYWIERIRKIEKGQQTFIPFDFSDEYVGGLLLEKTKLGFKTKLVYSDKIHGFGIGKSSLDKRIADNSVNFIEEVQREWLIGEDALFKGLDWSIKELTNQN